MAKKILVVDDNPLVRKMLCRIVETQADYHLCAEAENGQEAIALSIKHRPDLIILDLEMPIMNGVDAANLLVDRVVSKGDGYSLIGHIRSLVPA